MNAIFPEIPGYDVEAELGRGGMGVVYRARRHDTGRVLALKMILQGRDASFLELARFRVEAEAMACLKHPNIIKIRDVGVFAGYPYLGLEYAEQGSLKQVIGGRPRAPGWAADLVATIARAMEHAHGRGMLHRDLKPANVLIMEDGTPRISDFGLVKFAAPIASVSQACCTVTLNVLDQELERFAREFGAQYQGVADAGRAGDDDALAQATWDACATRTGALGGQEDGPRTVLAFLDEARRQAREMPGLDDLTRTGAVMGSPNYMAPEQASGSLEKIGPATDIYAMGGILYELLTGRPPVAPGPLMLLFSQVLTQPPVPPRRVVPEVPAALEAICLRCLEKDPRRRYPRAADLADELERFLERHPGGREPWPVGHPGTPSPDDCSGGTTTIPEDRGTRTRTWWPFARKARP